MFTDCGLRTMQVAVYSVHVEGIHIHMDQITIKTPNPKGRLFLKYTCKGIWRQVFICLRTPPLLGFCGFCLGWQSNFVRSESGQIHNV
jgi:hypothetical protein